MIARLFYLVILKMGYLLFFSGGNEIRHFIALLRSYRGTLYTKDGWELREEVSAYNAFLGAQKVDMDPENSYSWDYNAAISKP